MKIILMAHDSNETLFSEGEFHTFPEPTKKKLARFLSEGNFGADVSFEEMKLLRRAAGRLRHESLDSACKDLEQKFGNNAEDQSTPGFYPNITSADQPTEKLDPCTQVYHVSFAKDRKNTTFAFVYDVTSGHCYTANIKKGSVLHCVSACRCLKDDAPYIFIRTSLRKSEQLLSYDVILGKWENILNPQRISLQPYLVEIQNSVYMFGGKSLDIRKLVSGKWRPCAALVYPVFNPMYVAVGNKLTIFDGKTVQLFDAATNKVKTFDTFTTVPQGVAINIANHACVVTTSAIVQFDESTESCSLQRLNSNLLMDTILIGAICHNRQVHIITKKNVGFRVFRLSLDDFSIAAVCFIDMPPRSGDFSVLSSCMVQSSQDYRLLPFLDYDEARKLSRRLANS